MLLDERAVERTEQELRHRDVTAFLRLFASTAILLFWLTSVAFEQLSKIDQQLYLSILLVTPSIFAWTIWSVSAYVSWHHSKKSHFGDPDTIVPDLLERSRRIARYQIVIDLSIGFQMILILYLSVLPRIIVGDPSFLR